MGEGEAEASAPTEGDKDGSYKIGLSVLNSSGQFFISIIEAAKAEIADLGGELMVNDAQDDGLFRSPLLGNPFAYGCALGIA